MRGDQCFFLQYLMEIADLAGHVILATFFAAGLYLRLGHPQVMQ